MMAGNSKSEGRSARVAALLKDVAASTLLILLPALLLPACAWDVTLQSGVVMDSVKGVEEGEEMAVELTEDVETMEEPAV